MEDKREEADKSAREINSKLTDLYMKCVLPLSDEKVLIDFPDYLNDSPEKITFEYQKKRVKQDKESSAKKKKRVKSEVPESAEGKHKARACRYSGGYQYDKLLLKGSSSSLEQVKKTPSGQVYEKISEDNFFAALEMRKSDSTNGVPVASCSKSGQKEGLNNIEKTSTSKLVSKDSSFPKKPKKVSKALSDTSSDEDEMESASSQQKNPVEQNDEDLVNQKPKKAPKNEVKPKVDTKKQLKSQNSKILKELFNETGDFDTAMKNFARKKKELDSKLVPPKIIPAPLTDPSVKGRKKPRKTPEKPNEHLGGIFTVNNGWDEPTPKADLTTYKIPKLKRPITPPKIVNNRMEDEDIMEAHDEFMHGFMLPESSFPSPHSEPKDSNDEEFIQRQVTNVMPKSKSSINSSEEESDCSDTATIKPPPRKIHKLSFSDDEDEKEPSENFKRTASHDYDALEICADYGDLGDFEEDEPMPNAPLLETVVDGLKITGCVQRKVQQSDIEKEFEMNTREITQHIVDPETDNVLKKFYGNVCPAYLDGRCSMPQCHKSHSLISESILLQRLTHASYTVLTSVFQVALRFYRLFQTYITVFVEICVSNRDDKGLVELVKACDRYPRTIVCYKDIVQKLIYMDYMKQHRAISFIIENHTDSEIAREIILSMIIDSGPCLSFFMDYVEKVHMQQSIRIDTFSRILHACVAYQNPKLPNFCLKYLQSCPSNQYEMLNTDHMRNFLMMNKLLSELNDYRETSAMIITQKLLQSGTGRIP